MKELLSLICLIGIVQSFFLFIVLFIKKKNRTANRLLSLILLFSGIDLIEVYLTLMGSYLASAPSVISLIPYPYIYGPSILLYSKVLISGKDNYNKRLLLLYLPFFPAFLINIVFNYILSNLPAPHSCGTYGYIPVNEAGIFYKAALYGIAYHGLWKYSKRLKEFFSNVTRLQLVWLRVTILSLFVIEFSIYIHYWMNVHGKQDICPVEIISMFMGIALLFAISFLAMLQPEIFNRIRLMNVGDNKNAALSGPRYDKFRLSPGIEEEIVIRLKKHMDAEKPYLDEDLTLQDLADDMSISAQQLSMILNIHMKQNFYNFINVYRVREAEQKLSDPANTDENILNIAYRSGFNSKSTFNAMFKKFTGKTPRQYRSSLS